MSAIPHFGRPPSGRWQIGDVQDWETGYFLRGSMTEIINLVAHRRRTRLNRARHLDPVIVEVIDALSALGGVAHRKVIADHVFSARSGSLRSSPKAVEQEIFGSLDVYAAKVAQRRAPAALLERPLGADSYRWALTPAGAALLAQPRERPGEGGARRIG